MTDFLTDFFDSFGGNQVFKYIKKGNLPKRLRTTDLDSQRCGNEEGIPRFKKKSDVLKIANSGNFKTVNYIQIGRFCSDSRKKNLVIFGTTLEITFFARIATKLVNEYRNNKM